ncbi:MAG: hypothetical protein QOJ99_2089 [Bryobacterales bacterium]|jgi:hypothetical protein|nr:hypothetical protein [Bryobacterales bacterium]
MRLRKALWLSGGGFALLTALYAGTSFDSTASDRLSSNPRPFRVYSSLEPFDDVDLPLDYSEKTEWVQARLMYPPHPQGRFSRPLRFGGYRDWREGGTSWSQDYPRADRLFAMAVRRLTRVHVRSVEQPVNPDDGGDIFNWPWLVAGEMGDWKLTESQALKVREYLLRGGFLMLDDFWGTREWNRFMDSMSIIFPDRQIVEIADDDPIFHMIYDVDEKYTIPGQWALRAGTTYRDDGATPHWRGIYDDKGRLMVVMSFNSDIGDSWEWSDSPNYPERYSALGIRIGVNDVAYALTH